MSLEALVARALDLAREGAGRASPNPMVGSLVVSDGEVVGAGYHVHEDRDHAEVVALRAAGGRAQGATLVVTLEPCSTQGRTPPCTDAILRAGIRRVVTCTADPNPAHAGRGLRALRAAGVEVVAGPGRRDAVALNRRFFKWITTGRPHVTLKAAQSLDGRIAPRAGQSRWISSEASRRHAHLLRHDADAVACGVGTAVADDPRLSARGTGRPPKSLLRCVLDPTLRVAPTARVFGAAAEDESAGPVLLFARAGVARDPAGARRRRELEAAGADVVEVPPHGGDANASHLDLDAVLAHLGGERRALGLLVEGGGRTLAGFLRQGVADEIVAYVAPLVLGDEGTIGAFHRLGAERLADATRLLDLRATALGVDLLVEASVEGGFDVDLFAARLERLEAG
jgi:diaminohydroxyphosphoribosylaminopyrimidine deaminase/5-amino-6-(5-phosphoribosylamino)uracil reductase